MVDIITRAGKGSPLTHAELDGNFTNLKAAIENGTIGRYTALILAAKPVAYWKFDDKFGATQLLDSSGNGYHLTPVNKLMTARGGLIGDTGRGMYSVGGSSSYGYATIPTTLGAVWPASAFFSIEALVCPYTQTQGAYTSIFCISAAASSTVGDVRLSLMNNGARTPYFSVGTSSTTTDGVNTATTQEYVPYDWLHIVSTSDGTTLSLYMNGDLVSQRVGAYNVPIMARPKGGVISNPFTPAGGSADTPMYGIFDEISLYNTCLTADQVAAHYRVARGGIA